MDKVSVEKRIYPGGYSILKDQTVSSVSNWSCKCRRTGWDKYNGYSNPEQSVWHKPVNSRDW